MDQQASPGRGSLLQFICRGARNRTGIDALAILGGVGLSKLPGESGRMLAGERLPAPSRTAEDILQGVSFGFGPEWPRSKWSFAERFATSDCQFSHAQEPPPKITVAVVEMRMISQSGRRRPAISEFFQSA